MSAAGDALREQAGELMLDAEEFSRQIALLSERRSYAQSVAAKLRNAARNADLTADKQEDDGA